MSKTDSAATAATTGEQGNVDHAQALAPYYSKVKATQRYLRGLHWHLTAHIDEYVKRGTKVWQTADGPLIHIDNGGSLLAVGHLDAVGWTGFPMYNPYNNTIVCRQLDDRLGVWTLFDVLPQLTDVKFDILLTDKEEVGKSTAKLMTAEMWKEMGKDYNWMFEMDRGGTDVVMYDYETDAYKKLLTDQGWVVGRGSFTDIKALDSFGIAGFNFGVGYRLPHGDSCNANLEETLGQCAAVARFIDTHHTTKLTHEKKTYTATTYGSGYRGRGGGWQGYGAGYDNVDWKGSEATAGGEPSGGGHGSHSHKHTTASNAAATGAIDQGIREYCPLTNKFRAPVWNTDISGYVFDYTRKEKKRLRDLCEEHPDRVPGFILRKLWFYLGDSIPKPILAKFERAIANEKQEIELYRKYSSVQKEEKEQAKEAVGAKVGEVLENIDKITTGTYLIAPCSACREVRTLDKTDLCVKCATMQLNVDTSKAHSPVVITE